MPEFKAGRLRAVYYGPKDGDKVLLEQTHRNGSTEVVGVINLDAGEIEDAIYLLRRARFARGKEI